MEPECILPTSDDSILIEIGSSKFFAQEWDFYSDGEIAVAYDKGAWGVDIKLVKATIEDMIKHLEVTK